jgi:hypothetical protein
MAEKTAKILSILFHPVLIPTMGFILLMNSGFYFSMLSWEAKRYILLVIIFSTAILPLLTVAVMALNSKFDLSMENTRDRIILLLFTSVYYYLGYMILDKIKVFPLFKLFLLASVLVIVVLMFVSIRWKISSHMAALGSITGTLFALSFRLGINPVWAILATVLISGAVGTARLILNKHNLWQVLSGYIAGFTIMYLAMYFI